MSEIGHNSDAAANQLKTVVERIEHVEQEMRDLADGRKEIYVEAKSNGYDVKALKAIISRRRQDQKKLADHEMLVETYESRLGPV